jgi:DNA mismatch repair protein MutS
MFVITGPNNGGKTTYVRTVGLVQLMSQKGLFVTAESAEVSFVDGMYTHFVTPDDITKGEGRYRNELIRVKEIFEEATPYSLVILDEPCGGTSYEEGCRQSLVVLDGIHKLGPATYYTTHMHPVAEAVDSGRYPAARNLSVECRYDGKKIKYTYKVKAGASDRSYGEEIARDIGLMPEKIEELVAKGAEKRGYAEIIRK